MCAVPNFSGNIDHPVLAKLSTDPRGFFNGHGITIAPDVADEQIVTLVEAFKKCSNTDDILTLLNKMQVAGEPKDAIEIIKNQIYFDYLNPEIREIVRQGKETIHAKNIPMTSKAMALRYHSTTLYVIAQLNQTYENAMNLSSSIGNHLSSLGFKSPIMEEVAKKIINQRYFSALHENIREIIRGIKSEIHASSAGIVHGALNWFKAGSTAAGNSTTIQVIESLNKEYIAENYGNMDPQLEILGFDKAQRKDIVAKIKAQTHGIQDGRPMPFTSLVPPPAENISSPPPPLTPPPSLSKIARDGSTPDFLTLLKGKKLEKGRPNDKPLVDKKTEMLKAISVAAQKMNERLSSEAIEAQLAARKRQTAEKSSSKLASMLTLRSPQQRADNPSRSKAESELRGLKIRLTIAKERLESLKKKELAADAEWKMANGSVMTMSSSITETDKKIAERSLSDQERNQLVDEKQRRENGLQQAKKRLEQAQTTQANTKQELARANQSLKTLQKKLTAIQTKSQTASDTVAISVHAVTKR